MRTVLKGSIVALVMAGALIGVAGPASAAHVSISVDPGVIAFGYADGYWDRDHQWHGWANPADARWYRSHYRSHYFGHPHDRDHDGGWRNEWWHDHHH